MFNLISISNLLCSYGFFLTVESISLVVKLVFFGLLLFQGIRSVKISKPFFFLLGVFAGAIFENITWIIFLLPKVITGIHINSLLSIFFIRISWAFFVLQCVSLILFLGSLLECKRYVSIFRKAVIVVGVLLCSYYLYLSIFKFKLICKIFF